MLLNPKVARMKTKEVPRILYNKKWV